ncbi:MAG TPA: sulfatase [Candidatus Krumholzibacteria bacterium]|nr:sulfatase [Candidatus Krumholzibacteria bacterium]HRX50554.1 sulfatase [Candidatus Krumholzibacteria bacterium]
MPIPRHLPRAALLLAAALLLSGCGRDPQPNILLITLDTLRADHVGAYGYERATLPHLEAALAGAVRFASAQSVTPLTAPSHGTMLTGRFPAEHGATENGFVLDAAVPTLAEILSADGYRTGGFVSARPPLGAGTGFERGFQVFSDGGHQRRAAPQVMDDVMAFLDAADGRPFFLWAHLYDIHRPYATPRDFPKAFTPGRPALLRSIESLQEDGVLDRDDLEFIRGRYDEGIAYVDHCLQPLWERLAREGLLETTVVVVTSDHGEELHELGHFGHNNTVYEWETRVPLWILAPGAAPRPPVEETVSLMDVFPTLLDLAGVEPAAEPAGRSLRPLLFGHAAELRADLDARAVFSRVVMTEGKEWPVNDAAARRGAWKLHRDPDGGDPALFDLTGHVTEIGRENTERKDVRHGLDRDLRAWIAVQDAIQAGKGGQAIAPELKRQLEALGY